MKNHFENMCLDRKKSLDSFRDSTNIRLMNLNTSLIPIEDKLKKFRSEYWDLHSSIKKINTRLDENQNELFQQKRGNYTGRLFLSHIL